MALATTKKVLIKFDVDSGGAVTNVEKLGDATDELEGKTKKSAKSISDFIGGIDSTVEKAKRAYADIANVAKVAIDQFKYSLEQSRLETGAAGVSIDGLRRASAGLKTQTDLLRDAVTLKSAAFKLSQTDMEDVEGAERALIRSGHDAEKVHQALSQAITKLSTEGLQELGINVQKAGLSMDDTKDRAELFKRVLGKLKEESNSVAGEQLSVQEQMAKTGVDFENAVNRIKVAIGNLVSSMQPLIAKAVELAGKVPKAAAGFTRKWMKDVLGIDPYLEGVDETGKSTYELPLAEKARGTGARLSRASQLFSEGNVIAGSRLAGGSSEEIGSDEAMQFAAAWLKKQGWRPAAEGATPGYQGKSARDAASNAANARLDKFSEDALALIGKATEGFGDAFGDWGVLDMAGIKAGTLISNAQGNAVKSTFSSLVDGITSLGDAMVSAKDAVAESMSGETMMEKWFGKVGDFDIYAESFKAFTGVVTSGYDAMVDGNESLGASVKHAVGNAIKALGAQMAVESVKELAYGFAALAWPGGQVSAGAHFLAAAKFAGGAALAGVVAHGLGTGAGGGGGGGGSGYGGGAGAAAPYSGGTGSNGPQRTQIIIVGDNMDPDQSPRAKQQALRTQVERVTATRGGEY